MVFSMKEIKYILFIILSSVCFSVSAQYDYPGQESNDSTPHKMRKSGWYRDSKLFFGGVPSLMFGSITYIELPPYVGYKISPYFWAGLGPLYMYYKDNDWNYETSIYGGKVFAQLFLVKNLDEKIHINLGDLYFYAESNMFNLEPADMDPFGNIITHPRKWINSTLIGGGFRYAIGYRSGFSINILWDITRDPYSPYSNPEIRLGFDL
jgi:hypothetical protein